MNGLEGVKVGKIDVSVLYPVYHKDENLTLDHLLALTEGRAQAVIIKNFLERRHASELTEKILKKGHDYYENAASIGRIGMAFYEAERDSLKLNDYFKSTLTNTKELRSRCYPNFSPMDLLRCMLDELWPAGAMLESLYGKKMFAGMCRVVNPGVTFLAHHDILSKDAPDSFRAHSLKCQIACNVYLSMPSQGGELWIWNREIGEKEFDAMRGSSYGIEPKLLGEPSIVLRPETGDMILFNSRLMHAVSAGNDAPRLSISCFVGFRSQSSPLTLWS